MIWYVAFHPGKCLWGRRFRHVSLVGFENGTWLNFDLHRTGVEAAMIYHHDDAAVFRQALMENCVVVEFGHVQQRTMRSFIRPLTCVSFVKHTLGIRSSALLPDTLFKTLTQEFNLEVVNDSANAGAQPTGTSAKTTG